MPALHVKDVSQASFEADVIERSRVVPVVVDFWAPWCGPCRTLGPILEREIEALGGRVELAKLDTDANAELAARFAIRGIPAVKAFADGHVVDEFVGAQPAAAVRAFLARLAPSPGRQALAAAVAALAAGRGDEAEAALRAVLDDAEVGAEAAFRLAHALLDGGADADEIDRLAGRVEAHGPFADRLEELATLAAFVRAGRQGPGEADARARLAVDGKDATARYALAAALGARGAWADALAALTEIVGRRGRPEAKAAHAAMLAIFDHLGGAHELTQEFRRRLQILT